MRRHLVLAAALGLGLALPGAAAAQEPGKGSPNLAFVDNIDYPVITANWPKPSADPTATQPTANYGTDIEFATIRGRRYAIGGSYRNGMQIVDVTNPARAKKAAVYDCNVTQGDVQVFRQADEPGRVFAAYTSDTFGNVESDCYREAAALGFAVRRTASTSQGANNGRNGTFIVDITNPRKPSTVSFVEVTQGSHNQTVHPSGEWLYNSNSDLVTSSVTSPPAVEIFDLRDPRNPAKKGELKLQTRPGLGTESHDITFSDDGTRAYSAALSHGVVIDTSNPGEPRAISTFDDEAINVWHQSDPFTITGEDGRERNFLLVEDEFAGAAGGPVCPSGGVHVFDITGDKEKDPQKVGYWNIEDVAPTHNPAGTCTAHVFDIHEDEQLMTIAFYNGGVRIVDLAGLASGKGIKAIASYQTKDADSWSFKAPRVTRDGVFYAYGNDIARGMDIYRFDGSAKPTDKPGTWLPAGAADSGPVGADRLGLPQAPTATAATASRSGTVSLAGYRMNCLLK